MLQGSQSGRTRPQTASTDADGKFFFRERIETAKAKGKGWQDYKFTNPLTKTIEEKRTYFEKYEDVIVAGGVYKQ